jgi:hypothetical protein
MVDMGSVDLNMIERNPKEALLFFGVSFFTARNNSYN